MARSIHFIFTLLSIDSRSFTLGRVFTGLIIIVDALLRCQNLREHYTDGGILPREFRMADMRWWEWSVHLTNGSTGFAALMFALLIFLGVCIAMGWQRRLSSLAAWLLLTSLAFRNPGVCTAGDVTLRLLLFWSMFIGSRQSTPGANSTDAGYYRDIGTAGLLLQVALIYWVTALLKYHEVWRTDGTAIQWALSIESFQGPLATLALQYPGALKVLTFITLRLEEIGPLIALLPFRFGLLRTLAVLAFIGFHIVGIALTIRLGTFPWISAIAWVFFLPPYFWDSLLPRLCPWFQKLPIRLSAVEEPLSTAAWSPKFRNAAAMTALAYVGWWNLCSVVPKSWGNWMPRPATFAGYALGIGQNWSLFAPRPASRDGWYVADALLDSGRRVDPLHGGAEVSLARPAGGIAAEYENSRSQRLLQGMFYSRMSGQINGFASWIQRTWNNSHTEKIAELRVYFMLVDPWYTEDGIRKIQMYPFEKVDSSGRAVLAEDTRWIDPNYLLPRPGLTKVEQPAL